MTQSPELKAFFEDGFCEESWGPQQMHEVSRTAAEQVVRLPKAESGRILDRRELIRPL